jgi:dihydrofolate reductase
MMGRMKISLIAAMGKNRELGFNNKLPWSLPDDLKHFRALTKGHPVIMGRKTHEAIGRVLPDRKNIIVTRNKDYKADGCIVVGSMDEAVARAREGAKEDEEIFVIGGAEVYALGLPFADKMYLTSVDATMQADAYFPKFNEKEWKVVSEEPHATDEAHPYVFIFKVYERITSEK